MKAPINRPRLELGLLGELRIGDILYEAEEPVVFTVTVGSGQSMLAYVADHDASGRWLLLAPCSARTVTALQSGAMAVREALTASWMWLVLTENGRPSSAWSVELSDIPADHIPSPESPLLPEHEPLIATRAIGPTIVAGDIPSSVVAFVSQGTTRAVKTLLDFVLDRSSDGGGRPPDEMRALYDLPVTRFAFSSFELSFAHPRSLVDSSELRRVGVLLQRGLAWAAGSDQRPLEASSDEERDAVLRAIMALTPPTTGPIEQVSVSGHWMVKGITNLTRISRRRVHAEIRRVTKERVVKREGRVGEIDYDRQSFTLRDTGEGVDIRCVFLDEHYDDAIDSFTSQSKVVVVGVERDGRLYVAAVKPISQPLPQ